MLSKGFDIIDQVVQYLIQSKLDSMSLGSRLNKRQHSKTKNKYQFMPRKSVKNYICVVDIENPAMLRKRQVKIYEFCYLHSKDIRLRMVNS